MGLTLQFAIGKKQDIINAVENFDFDFIDKLESENRLADFSLHLIPNDLNFLVNCASELKGKPMLDLRENLDTQAFFIDSEDGGAYFVNPIISSLFSEFDKSDVTEIANKWFDKMRVAHNEELEISEAALVAIQKLISISKEAKNLNLDLVHIWFL